MEKAAFKEYLENRYKNQLEYYDKAATKNQKRYKLFQWLLIILSATTPILAALQLNWGDLQIPVVIISSVVAILTTGMKTFQYQELWVSYRTTMEQLKPELYYYNFNAGPYAEEGVNKEKLFVARAEAIMSKEQKGWPPAKNELHPGKEEK